MPSKERNLTLHRSKCSPIFCLCFIVLLSACNAIEVFVENKEVPFQKTYTSFVLVNKELGIQGFSDSDLDKQVQVELEAQLIASGLVYDAKQPDLVIRYHSNEDLRQRESVNNMNPYSFWGMRMYNPWLFNPMMGNSRPQVTTTKYALLQVIIDVIDPEQDKYLMTLTGVAEVSQPKSKPKITLKVVEKIANTFLQYNSTPIK